VTMTSRMELSNKVRSRDVQIIFVRGKDRPVGVFRFMLSRLVKSMRSNQNAETGVWKLDLSSATEDQAKTIANIIMTASHEVEISDSPFK